MGLSLFVDTEYRGDVATASGLDAAATWAEESLPEDSALRQFLVEGWYEPLDVVARELNTVKPPDPNVASVLKAIGDGLNAGGDVAVLNDGSDGWDNESEEGA